MRLAEIKEARLAIEPKWFEIYQDGENQEYGWQTKKEVNWWINEYFRDTLFDWSEKNNNVRFKYTSEFNNRIHEIEIRAVDETS